MTWGTGLWMFCQGVVALWVLRWVWRRVVYPLGRWTVNWILDEHKLQEMESAEDHERRSGVPSLRRYLGE